MANLLAQSCSRHCRHGLVCCPEHWLRSALCLRYRAARSLGPRVDQRHNQPDSRVGCTSDNRGLSLGRGSALPRPRSRPDLWQRRQAPIARHGHPGQAYCSGHALAEWLCRTADRIDPARVCGPHHCLGRDAFASGPEILRRLLQLRQNASILEQGCAGFSPGSANRCDQFTRHPGRTSSPLWTDLRFSVHTGGGFALFFTVTFPTPFLQNFCAVETGYYDQCEMDTLRCECSFALPFMPLTQVGGGGHPRALTYYCVRNLYAQSQPPCSRKSARRGAIFGPKSNCVRRADVEAVSETARPCPLSLVCEPSVPAPRPRLPSRGNKRCRPRERPRPRTRPRSSSRVGFDSWSESSVRLTEGHRNHRAWPS